MFTSPLVTVVCHFLLCLSFFASILRFKLITKNQSGWIGPCLTLITRQNRHILHAFQSRAYSPSSDAFRLPSLGRSKQFNTIFAPASHAKLVVIARGPAATPLTLDVTDRRKPPKPIVLALGSAARGRGRTGGGAELSARRRRD